MTDEVFLRRTGIVSRPNQTLFSAVFPNFNYKVPSRFLLGCPKNIPVTIFRGTPISCSPNPSVMLSPGFFFGHSILHGRESQLCFLLSRRSFVSETTEGFYSSGVDLLDFPDKVELSA